MLTYSLLVHMLFNREQKKGIVPPFLEGLAMRMNFEFSEQPRRGSEEAPQ
jgi:hypothetical protein